jgi:hypothetical protein
MNAQGTKRQTDWLLRAAQISSITIAALAMTEFLWKRWGAIAAALGLGGY